MAISSRVPRIPEDLERTAILLDVDGTILDLAPTPREVFVPHSLREVLDRLLNRTGGAVAFVSGRPLQELDLIFSPLQLPAIGGHGAEMRTVPGEAAKGPRLSPLDPDVKRRFAAIAEDGPGIILADKGYSLAAHYLLAPPPDLHRRRSGWSHRVRHHARAERDQHFGGPDHRRRGFLLRPAS